MRNAHTYVRNTTLLNEIADVMEFWPERYEQATWGRLTPDDAAIARFEENLGGHHEWKTMITLLVSGGLRMRDLSMPTWIVEQSCVWRVMRVHSVDGFQLSMGGPTEWMR